MTRDFQFKVHRGLELDPQLKYLFYLWSFGIGLALAFCCVELSGIKSSIELSFRKLRNVTKILNVEASKTLKLK